MATITVAQTGPWSAPSTWVGGALPTAADSISLLAAHTLTVDGDYAIAGGTIGQDGRLVIAENCRLTNTTNQLTFGTTTTPRRSYLELRAGAELALAANLQLYACGVSTAGTTKANPAKISGTANITATANSGRGFFNCQHLLFLLTGTVNVRWGAAGLSFTDASSYVFNNCTFNGPSYDFGSLTQAVSNFIFNASDFRDATCTFYFSGNTGLSEIKGSTFSANTLKALTLYAGGSTVDFTGTIFNEYNVVTRTKAALNLNFDSTFAALRSAPAATSLVIVEDDSTSGDGLYENSYYYIEIENLRALSLGTNATSANADATHIVSKNVFELTAASAGNPIVVGPTRIEVYENVQVGYVQPWASRAFAVGATPYGLSVVRNTQYAQAGDASPALVSFEQAVVAYPGEITAHSNLSVWETTPHPTTFAALACERSSTIDDSMTLVGHNATYGAGSGARYAYASAVTDLTANDIILPSVPTFVDPTRNLASWGAANGADGTANGAINLLLARNGYDAATKSQNGTAAGVTVQDLVSWVRAGYVPTTSALAGAGYLGVDIGALDVGSSADDTAPNLTDATATATGPTTATATVTTDDGNGTLYFLASTNSTESAATVKAALSQSVTADGEQSISLSALDPETTYYVHFVQINGAGLESASVVSTAAFTTDSIAVNLVADDLVTGPPVLGTPALGQVHALTATGITTSAPVLGIPALGQVHGLTATALTTGAPVLGTPAVGQIHSLMASALVVGSPVLGTPSLTENAADVDALTAVDLVVGSPALGAPALGQIHALGSDGLTVSSPVLGTPSLEIGKDHLTAQDLVTEGPVLGAPTLKQIHALVAPFSTAAPEIGTPALTQAHALIPVELTAGSPVLGTPMLFDLEYMLQTRAEFKSFGTTNFTSPLYGTTHIELRCYGNYEVNEFGE